MTGVQTCALPISEQAARNAGYAESTARTAHKNIEGHKVLSAFRHIMCHYIDPEKVAQRMQAAHIKVAFHRQKWHRYFR